MRFIVSTHYIRVLIVLSNIFLIFLKGLFGEKRVERHPRSNQVMALAEKTDFGVEEYMFLEGGFP